MLSVRMRMWLSDQQVPTTRTTGTSSLVAMLTSDHSGAHGVWNQRDSHSTPQPQVPEASEKITLLGGLAT